MCDRLSHDQIEYKKSSKWKKNTNIFGTMYFIAKTVEDQTKLQSGIESLQLQSSIGQENCKECSDTETGTSIIGKSSKWYNNTGGTSYRE